MPGIDLTIRCSSVEELQRTLEDLAQKKSTVPYPRLEPVSPDDPEQIALEEEEELEEPEEAEEPEDDGPPPTTAVHNLLRHFGIPEAKWRGISRSGKNNRMTQTDVTEYARLHGYPKK